MKSKVIVLATPDDVYVRTTDEDGRTWEKLYDMPGMLSGSDLAEVLDSLGVTVEYTYND